jgi:hypothetical protein
MREIVGVVGARGERTWRLTRVMHGCSRLFCLCAMIDASPQAAQDPYTLEGFNPNVYTKLSWYEESR